MKKLFMMAAAAVFVLAGCDPNDSTDFDPAKAFKFTKTAPATESVKVAKAGGEVTVSVEVNTALTSVEDIAVSATEEWVTPGEPTIEGNIVSVVFTVAENDTYEERTATLVVASEAGEDPQGSIPVDVVQAQAELPQFKFDLTSEADVEVDNTAQSVVVEVEINPEATDYNDIVASADEAWVVAGSKVLEGNIVKITFAVQVNAGFVAREATLTIASDDAAEPQSAVTVDMNQAQTDRLTIDATAPFEIDADGDSFEVNVTANVEYDVNITGDGDGAWVSKSGVENKWTFTVGALTVESTREATITFVSKTNAELKATATVSQTFEAGESPLVGMVGFMGDVVSYPAGKSGKNRAWPMWDGNTAGLMGMNSVTYEALVNSPFDAYSTPARISAIMGIEGKLLLRVGDASPVPATRMEVCWNQNAYSNASYPAGGTDEEGKLSLAGMTVPQNQWVHLAVTYDVVNTEVKAYINGTPVGTYTAANNDQPFTKFYPVDLAVTHSDETASVPVRCFWIGYAYEPGRSLNGMISEVRVWNRILTEQEINADDHFYSVAPNSTGLVAYWKFNDNSTGTTKAVKDHSPMGNDLNSQAQISWREVSLPEEE